MLNWLKKNNRYHPQKKNWSRLVTYYNPQSFAAEKFQSLNLNLIYAMKKTGIKTILISSIHKDEGKSTIASNISYLMGQNNLKTLMIDGNLKSPALNYIFGFNNKIGLTDYLISEKMNLKEVILWSREYNLYFLPTGSRQQNVSEVLSTPKLKILLEELEEEFDIVVVDGPSFSSGAEALVWAKVVPNILLVVKDKINENYFSNNLFSKIDQLGAKFIGYVDNNKNTMTSNNN